MSFDVNNKDFQILEVKDILAGYLDDMVPSAIAEVNNLLSSGQWVLLCVYKQSSDDTGSKQTARYVLGRIK